MEKILGDGASFPCELLNSKVLPPAVVDRLKADSSLKSPYFDPLLKNSRRTYADFIRKMFDSGVIEFRRQCREQVGLFCVWKKSGRQRLVVDGWLTNLWFSDPEPVSLATGTSFGSIEVDDHGPIELAGVDMSDAFYNIELPEVLRDLFGLLPLKAIEAGVGEIDGIPLKDNEKVFPVFKAVPMGWTHALWLRQYLHEAVVNDIAGLGHSNRFVDGKVPPTLAPLIHTEYVDNFIAISQTSGEARQAAEAVSVELQRRGLPVHEVEAGMGGETLGWKFEEDRPSVVVTPKRLWKLKMATEELLKRGRASGRLVEIIVGHFAFVGLLCREFLSVFQATYSFIRKQYHEETVLWEQVRRELLWASALLPLVRRDLDSHWSDTVFATDASTWGRGVAVVNKPVNLVSQVGRVNDRWKFSQREEVQVQGVEDEINQLPDPESLQVPAAADLAVLEHGHKNLSQAQGLSTDYVPLSFLDGDWRQLSNGPWERVEGIPCLEGQAIVWVLQHLARSSKQHSRKHLILTDSMSCTLALSKGRSSTKTLNRICRQAGALLLATGMRMSCRWIPSEINPADGPSRGKPWKFFDARAVAREWTDNVAPSKPLRSQGWRCEAQGQLRRELDGAAAASKDGGEACDQASQQGGSCSGARKEVRPAPGNPWCRKGADLFGTQVSDRKPKGVVSECMADLCSELSEEESESDVSQVSGRVRHYACEPDVLGRPQHRRRARLHGCGEVHEIRRQEAVRSATHHESSPRVCQAGACSRSGASSFSLPGEDRRVFGDARATYDRTLAHVDLGGLLSSRRMPEVDLEKPDCSITPPETLGGDPQQQHCRRKATAVESGRDGRGNLDRSTLHGMVGTSVGEMPQEEKSARTSVRVHHGQGCGLVQTRRGGPELPAINPLSDPPRVSQFRPDVRLSNLARHHETRKVEVSQLRQKVHERRSPGRSVRHLESRAARRSHSSRNQDCRDIFSCVQKCPDQPLVLDFFSGSGHL